ncbi:MAG: antirestriction protein ArdA [Candidatus Omnitrophota bacterium]|nr:antirestriction protein ArdA [Candidatus Omnitrophota bacterium]
MQNTQTTPRIYVACLAAYNNGILHGQWIEANQEAGDIQAEIQDMLAQSPMPKAEEWAIHDYEGFCGLRLSEYEDMAKVAAMAVLIEEHGEAWARYADHVGMDDATGDGFKEAYHGQWDSEEDFAEHLAEETMEIPERLQYYIDYKKLARDLFIDEYFSAEREGCKVYVFSRH